MSDLRPCVVIPLYNHKDAIGNTLAQLSGYGLPIFVVDDGSDAQTQATLAVLARQYANLFTTLHLPVNGGKGVAVMAGLRAAKATGYTHAIQIDADGQHDANDVPLFLHEAQRHPDAVILGAPVYDDSVPKSRRYGRYLTHVWVWIETLSFSIRDSMCGFRLYPLDTVCALIDQVKLPARMDFDIEILVRLAWRGTDFHSIPTRVTYATDGISHFNLLWDNVRISRSHVRLVAGMLIRLPVWLARKVLPRAHETEAGACAAAEVRECRSETGNVSASRESDENNEARWWCRAERGSQLGIGLLVFSCRVLGLRVTGWLLYPVVAYFLLTGHAARDASRQYFTRLRASSPDIDGIPGPGWCSGYRHMLAFAQSSLDKFAAWSGRIQRRDIHFTDPAAFDAIVTSGKGAIVIGSHLGNLEMTRALAMRSKHGKVTAVVHTEHARRFNRALSSVHENFSHALMEVNDFGPQTAMLMQQRIDAGELLVIVGDRVPAHEAGRTVNAQFLGARAAFAQGPYILAHALGCPVHLFFCVKERDGYHLYFEPFAGRISLPRRERAQHIAQWAQRYAGRLEHYCRNTPYQWFNFFDFWARPDAG